MSAASDAKWPVGVRGRREVEKKLSRTNKPEETIREFQRDNSLHSMMARAFGTVPRHAVNNSSSDQETTNQVVESLDTDSVLEFLSHFGVSRLDVHKRVSDALLLQLEDEIRKTQDAEPLKRLLFRIWAIATNVPEMRPVVFAILKKLGSQTPNPVLQQLAKQDETRYAEMWSALPPLLKRLVWETDWVDRVRADNDAEDPRVYYELVESTMFARRVQPIVDAYCREKDLVESANRPFVSSLRERRVLTSQRRAFLKGAAAAATAPDATRAVSELRDVLGGGDTPAYRPNLLNAFLSILMARHGLVKDTELLGGASYLHCTLVADMLLSGPLPKDYQQVLTLARTLDEVVKAGVVSDSDISQIQESLRQIYPFADAVPPSVESEDRKETAKPSQDEALARIITSGLEAMKEVDGKSLFLNPVTDEIAPNYSRVIKQPMCIKTMESKVNSYRTLQEWESDVRLVFKNCLTYNVGNAGQWFRGEARRQDKAFTNEIYPQALKLYQGAVVKRTVDRPKRALNADGRSKETPPIDPLPGIRAKAKRRKKDGKVKDYPIVPPSTAAIASMLLADPFVVRIMLDRALKCLRVDVNRGASIPAAHRVLPSLLQLLHLASWSTRLCAIRGRLCAVPDVGMIPPTDNDIVSLTPFVTLRTYAPVLMRLFVVSELDRRTAVGGDLQRASQTINERHDLSARDSWDDTSHLDVLRALTEGALVHICQPGNTHESSLAVTFPKFDRALQQLSVTLWDQRPFFLSLIQALMRHKSKLSRTARDVIVAAWLEWLGAAAKAPDTNEGSMTSSSHECFVMLLNDWASLGNLLLPRDALLKFAADGVRASNSSESSPHRKFSAMWNKTEFASVQKQYERMLQHLPEAQMHQWKVEAGISGSAKEEDAVVATDAVADGPKDDSVAPTHDARVKEEL